MALTRRQALIGAGAAATAAALPGSAAAQTPASPSLPNPPRTDPERLARDERFWARVARRYAVSREVVNLENGFYGVMPTTVQAAYHRNIDALQRRNSLYLRNEFGADLESIRARIARVLGAATEEIAITRGATEALQLLISNYNRLRPGDAVMYADLDYDSMQYVMSWLPERRGVELVRFALPEPAEHDAVLGAYERQLDAHPNVKLLLLTHVSHRTGLLVPVAEVAALARARGVDVILDAAHSWGQVDFRIDDLGVDFAGFNLHKWMGAPLGVGFLWIRAERIAAVDPVFADGDYPRTDVRARVHTGTSNTANLLTVPDALAFHDALGTPNKQARLTYLRDRWVARARALPNVQILTPDDPRTHAGITSFRIAGRVTAAENTAVVRQLLEDYGVFTVRRGGVAAGQCVRVSPALYTSAADVDRFADALEDLSARLGQ